jgi:hypothetical protein
VLARLTYEDGQEPSSVWAPTRRSHPWHSSSSRHGPKSSSRSVRTSSVAATTSATWNGRSGRTSSPTSVTTHSSTSSKVESRKGVMSMAHTVPAAARAARKLPESQRDEGAGAEAPRTGPLTKAEHNSSVAL